MNGETTLVAISEVPSGSLSISGCAISVNRSLAKIAQGMNASSSAEHRLHEPVAQLEQVRHQRAFGQVFLLFSLAHDVGRRGVVGGS